VVYKSSALTKIEADALWVFGPVINPRGLFVA
jgi:hypothetical protein